MWQLNDKAVSLSAAQATQELALSRVRALEAERAHLKQVRLLQIMHLHPARPPYLHPASILYAQALEIMQREQQPPSASSSARSRCTRLGLSRHVFDCEPGGATGHSRL